MHELLLLLLPNERSVDDRSVAAVAKVVLLLLVQEGKLPAKSKLVAKLPKSMLSNAEQLLLEDALLRF